MSTTSKALIILIAIAAFIFGVMMNSSRPTKTAEIQTLLSAQLLDTEENSHRVSDHLKKLTLINFWASWCAPCRHEMPLFESLYQANSEQGFQIIGIAIDSPEKAQALLDSMGISYPILYAEKTGMHLMTESGNPNGLLPYSLLVDKEGNVLEQRLGAIDESQLSNWINKYVKSS